jgi:hypothetical protein
MGMLDGAAARLRQLHVAAPRPAHVAHGGRLGPQLSNGCGAAGAREVADRLERLQRRLADAELQLAARLEPPPGPAGAAAAGAQALGGVASGALAGPGAAAAGIDPGATRSSSDAQSGAPSPECGGDSSRSSGSSDAEGDEWPLGAGAFRSTLPPDPFSRAPAAVV